MRDGVVETGFSRTWDFEMEGSVAGVDGTQPTEPFPATLDGIGFKRVRVRRIFDNPHGAGTLHALGRVGMNSAARLRV